MLDRLAEFETLAKNVSPYMTQQAQQAQQAQGEKSLRRTASGASFKDVETGVVEIAKSAPLDDFVSSMETVKTSFERIARLMGDIETLHRSALVTVHVDEASRIAKRIEASSTLASAEAATVRRVLKAMDAETREQTLSASDRRLRTSKHRALCKRFLALMGQFETMQTTFRNKYRQQLERQYLLVHPEASRTELDRLHSDDSGRIMAQQIFKMANKAQAQQTLDEMKERHGEIQRLEKSMAELHQMFLDVAFIVAQQGHSIDKVDEYVQASLEATEQAAQVMTEAVVKQKRAQRRRWLMTGIGLVILVILVVIIVLALTNSL